VESQLWGSTVWLLEEAGSFDYTIHFRGSVCRELITGGGWAVGRAGYPAAGAGAQLRARPVAQRAPASARTTPFPALPRAHPPGGLLLPLSPAHAHQKSASSILALPTCIASLLACFISLVWQGVSHARGVT
jgi:hypothetical protein